MAEHILKTWPQFFELVRRGDKTFEVRKNDRNYAVGDTLLLHEFDPATDSYSGRKTDKVVTYVMRGGAFGVAEDHVVMAIR